MPTFGDILEGKGFRADIFMRRIDIESIPSETDEDAAQFLYKLFNEKVFKIIYLKHILIIFFTNFRTN